MSRALILTYHSIGAGPRPLSIDTGLFRAHLDCLAETGATILTVTELAEALRAGRAPKRAVVLTFDDGYRDVALNAAPLLLERGWRATVFCVAGWLGRTADWPTLPERFPRLPLATAGELRELATAGFEIGSHGMDHAPLARADGGQARREILESRALLEESVAARVNSFAYPYALPPSPPARGLVEREYAAACAGGLRTVGEGSDPFALPRVDAHYLRRPALLRRALRGSVGPYLATRRVGARSRRIFVADHA